MACFPLDTGWIPFGYYWIPWSTVAVILVKIFAMAQEKASFSIFSGESSQACEPIFHVNESVNFRSDESRSDRSSRRRERVRSSPRNRSHREERKRSRRDRSRSRDQRRHRSPVSRYESTHARQPSWPSPSRSPFSPPARRPSSPMAQSTPHCLLPVDVQGYPSPLPSSAAEPILEVTEGGKEDEIFPSDRDRLQAGRDFALRFLPSDYFCLSTTSRREKRIVPFSGFRHKDRGEKTYPLVAKKTIDAVSDVLKDRRDSSALPVSAVDYEASVYKMPEPLWNPDGDNFLPFRSVNSREAAPPSMRRVMQASVAAFDVLAYMKMVADAQVKALSSGWTSEEDMLAFQASTEALALASSDALALTSLSLANSTLLIRQRALGQLKVSATVKDQAWRSELTPDAWFGPAASAAVEEERRDPTVQARAIGSAISGALTKAVRQVAPPSRGTRQPFRQRGGRRGSANTTTARSTTQLAEFSRGRGAYRSRGQRGGGRGARKPSATVTSRDR